MANTRYWARIVEINVLLFLNLAAILKTSVFMSTVINFVSNNCPIVRYCAESIKGPHTMEDMTILQKTSAYLSLIKVD